MRLVTFEIGTPIGPLRRLGWLSERGVIDVNLAVRERLAAGGRTARPAELADALAPPDLLAFIETGAIADEAAAEGVEYALSLDADVAEAPGRRLRWDVSEVRLRAPLVAPPTIREFGQYIGHASQGGRRELAATWYEAPHYWKGNPRTIIGPDDVIAWPAGVERLDFELEIACVIGRGGVDISEADALDHVKGFTIFNDVCARDLQALELPAMKGPSKSHDFCSVVGPSLVSADELDVEHLVARVRVNGEEWATATTDDMYFGWPTVIAHASRHEGLVPGDMLVSGTLTGCSAIEHAGWVDSGPLLSPGDEIELEVEGIGLLRNRVAGERPSARETAHRQVRAGAR